VNPELQAQEHLDQALKLYQETEDFETGLAECDTALKLNPFLVEAHNLRGLLLEKLGKPLKAISTYKKALSLDPDFSWAKENLENLRAEFATHSQIVTLARYSFPTEAYIHKTKLESEGIWAFVADAETVTANWLYSNAIGGVRLQVKQEDVEKASEILNREPEPLEWDENLDEDEDKEEEMLCPECSSADVEYERYSIRLIFLSWLLLSVPLPFFKRKWKCQQCGYSWKESEILELEEQS